ncbi:MAG TPA: hypothetical protein VEK33_18610 [Terriglobales bacterium]|nr:hypothetical protein [Terriglobales bacterium]
MNLKAIGAMIALLLALYPPAGRAQMLGINGHPFDSAEYNDATGVPYWQQIKLVRQLGLQWYRVNVLVLPTGNDFSQMDKLLQLAEGNHVRLLPVIIPQVNQADSLSAIQQNAYQAAVSIVSHYKGRIHLWELDNEQDVYSDYVYGEVCGSAVSSACRPSLCQGTLCTYDTTGQLLYALGAPDGESPIDFQPQRLAIAEALLMGLGQGVHDADPTAQRIINFAWIHFGFLQAILSANIPFDIVGIHWYQNMGEITCPGQSLPCPANQIHPNVVTAIQSLTSKPIWMTELGYNPYNPVAGSSANRVLEEQYTSSTLETYLVNPGVYPFRAILIYELLDMVTAWNNGNSSQYGLYSTRLSSDGFVNVEAMKPLGSVLRRIAEELRSRQNTD